MNKNFTVRFKWELVEDGLYRDQRLVNFPSGLIVGGTRGTTFDNRGWDAWTDGRNILKPLGKYVTEDLAKRAVESAQSSPEEK